MMIDKVIAKQMEPEVPVLVPCWIIRMDGPRPTFISVQAFRIENFFFFFFFRLLGFKTLIKISDRDGFFKSIEKFGIFQ